MAKSGSGEIKEAALNDTRAGHFHAYDGSRPMPAPMDEDLRVDRHATWSSIRERQRQGGVVQKSFSIDEVEAIVRTAVAEALKSVQTEDAEIKIGGK